MPEDKQENRPIETIVMDRLDGAINALRGYATRNPHFLSSWYEMDLKFNGKAYAGERTAPFFNNNREDDKYLIISQEGTIPTGQLTLGNIVGVPIARDSLPSFPLGYYPLNCHPMKKKLSTVEKRIELEKELLGKPIQRIKSSSHSAYYGFITGTFNFYLEDGKHPSNMTVFYSPGKDSSHFTHYAGDKAIKRTEIGTGNIYWGFEREGIICSMGELPARFGAARTELYLADRSTKTKIPLPQEEEISLGEIALFSSLTEESYLSDVNNALELVSQEQDAVDTVLNLADGRKIEQKRLSLKDGRELTLSSRAYHFLKSEECTKAIAALTEFYQQALKKYSPELVEFFLADRKREAA